MQFKILPVAVALLAITIVVMAADPPKADIQHAKCYNHDHRRHWIAENEEVDAEAMKTVSCGLTAVASPRGQDTVFSTPQLTVGIIKTLHGASNGPSQPAITRTRLTTF